MKLHPTKTRVRRSRSTRLILMAALLALGTGLFAAFARPVVQSAVNPVEEKTVTDVTLEGVSVYLVRLFKSKDEALCRIEAARYTPRGAAGYILRDKDEYLVIGAGYETSAEAENVSLNLSVGESIEAVVSVQTQPEARLRVNSTKEQLEAFTGADAIIREASKSLREMSVQLDAGMSQPVEIRARLKSEITKLDEAFYKLDRAAGDEPNAIVAKWLSILENTRAGFREISTATYSTKLYMSSALKYAFIDVKIAHIDALGNLA